MRKRSAGETLGHEHYLSNRFKVSREKQRSVHAMLPRSSYGVTLKKDDASRVSEFAREPAANTIYCPYVHDFESLS